ncbi:hypothetical protein C8R30_11524 [Nitrosomonas nitrosa]|nr:hypothetical protein C8R30_11524 [Nitrosomonas nitrosa]
MQTGYDFTSSVSIPYQQESVPAAARRLAASFAANAANLGHSANHEDEQYDRKMQHRTGPAPARRPQ